MDSVEATVKQRMAIRLQSVDAFHQHKIDHWICNNEDEYTSGKGLRDSVPVQMR